MDEYTITYNVLPDGVGGWSTDATTEPSPLTPSTYNVLSSGGLPTTITTTRYGYRFDGWCMDEDSEINSDCQIVFLNNLIQNPGNHTLYAKWADNTRSCEPGNYYNGSSCARCSTNYYCPGTTYDPNSTDERGRFACVDIPGTDGEYRLNTKTGSKTPNECYKEKYFPCSEVNPYFDPNGLVSYFYYNSSTGAHSPVTTAECRVHYGSTEEFCQSLENNTCNIDLICNLGYKKVQNDNALGNLDISINATTQRYKALSNDGISSADTTGLSAGEWVDTFLYGDIKGKSLCSTMRWGSAYFVQMPPDASITSMEFQTCYCTVTEFTPNGGTTQSVVSPWAVRKDVDISQCPKYCARECASGVATNYLDTTYSQPIRETLYTQPPHCEKITYNIIYNGLETGETHTNALTITIDDINYNLTAPVSNARVFKGWCKGTSTCAVGQRITQIQASDLPTDDSTDINVYAVFENPTCTVVSDSGQTNVGTANVASIANNTITCNVTCDDGYSKDGYNNATPVQFSVPGNPGDSEVTATCKARTYEIILDSNYYTSVYDMVGFPATTKGTTKFWYRYKTSKTFGAKTCRYYTSNLNSESDETEANCLTNDRITIPTYTGSDFDDYHLSKVGGTVLIHSSGVIIQSIVANTFADGSETLYATWTPKNITCSAGYYLSALTAQCSPCESGFYCPGDNGAPKEYTYDGTDQGKYSCNKTEQYLSHDVYCNVDNPETPASYNIGWYGYPEYACSQSHNSYDVDENTTCPIANIVMEAQSPAMATDIGQCYLSFVDKGVYLHSDLIYVFSVIYSHTTGVQIKTCPKDYYCPGINVTFDQVDDLLNTFSPCVDYQSNTDNNVHFVKTSTGISSYIGAKKCPNAFPNADAGSENADDCFAKVTFYTDNSLEHVHATKTKAWEDVSMTTYTLNGDWPSDPAQRQGYSFEGWYRVDNDTPVSANTSLSGDVQIYAKWETVTYEITYEIGDGACQNDNCSPTTYNITSPDVKINTENNTPEKLGHSLVGWCIYNEGDTDYGTNCRENEATGNFVGTDEQVIIPTGSTGDVTAYAIWSANPINLNWFNESINAPNPDENNMCIWGTYKDADDDPDGVEGDINVPQITRPGYVFNGWKLKFIN